MPLRVLQYNWIRNPGQQLMGGQGRKDFSGEASAASAPPPMPGLPARQAAWRVLQAVAAGAYADVALERELGRQSLAGVDRALVTELAYGATRQRRLLDAWIDAHGKVPALRQPPRLRLLLHLGLYQLLFSQRVPPAAAVSTTVELAKQAGLGRLAPVVNGVLRAVLRCRDQQGAGPGSVLAEPWRGLVLPTDPSQAFGVRHSLPQWLVAELLAWLPPERAEAFGQACNGPPPLDLRVNALRSSREAVLAAFHSAGIAVAPLEDLPQGITLLERTGELRALPGFAEGHWSVQDRSAQRIAPLLAPNPGDLILDACAAPGGKSTQLLELVQGQAELWAVDRSEERLARLSANALRLGLEGIRPLVADACQLAQERPEWLGRFQRILLDAPCTGLGTLARHADARWRLSPTSVEELVVLQRQLLEGLIPLLAPGGRLVYATCSVHPRENAERVAAVLAAHPGWTLGFERQWWPGDASGGDGFYAAVIEAPPAGLRVAAAEPAPVGAPG